MNLIPLAIFLFNYACVTSGATIRGGTTQQNDFGRNDEDIPAGNQLETFEPKIEEVESGKHRGLEDSRGYSSYYSEHFGQQYPEPHGNGFNQGYDGGSGGGGGSQRSPCPAINTLANHGFINSNGIGIVLDDLAEALEKWFRISKDYVLLEGPIKNAIEAGLTYKDGQGREVIDIYALHRSRLHGVFVNGVPSIGEAEEHDASFFRKDDSEVIDLAWVDEFFCINDGEFLTMEEVAEYQRRRIRESCDAREASNFARPSTAGTRLTMATQAAFLFAMAASGGLGEGRRLNKSALRDIVENERLPANHHFDESILFTFGQGCSSENLRSEFRKSIENAVCEFCPVDPNEDFNCNNHPVPVNFGPLDLTPNAACN